MSNVLIFANFNFCHGLRTAFNFLNWKNRKGKLGILVHYVDARMKQSRQTSEVLKIANLEYEKKEDNYVVMEENRTKSTRLT